MSRPAMDYNGPMTLVRMPARLRWVAERGGGAPARPASRSAKRGGALARPARRVALAAALCLLSLPAPPVAGPARGDEAAGELPLEQIRTFVEVFSRVKKDYVEDMDDIDLLENAIRGMLEGLDPHSAYLDEDAYLDLQEGASGRFGGLGIEVGMEDGFIKVISPIDDTPAAKAGIQAGDLVVRLDGTPVKGLSLGEAVSFMRGEPGTDITLTIVRDGEEKPLKLTITRDVIKVNSVRARLLEPGFGYLRISHFQTRTAADAHRALQDLARDNNGRLEGLVLDLRNNPGGILNTAVGVSDLFLDRGLIVYTQGRIKDAALRFSAKPGDLLANAPIVALVNAGSASAAEIVAGALQDHKRAIIMGQRTFGKGSVQTILPISGNAALKLTTARYYTPSGRSIQVSGIEPDVTIARVKVEVLDEESGVTEKNLNRRLDNEAPGGAANGQPAGDGDAAEVAGAAATAGDYALQQALGVLKSLRILADDSPPRL